MDNETDKTTNFYGELDRRAARSCFSFTTLIVLLLGLLLVGSAAVIYLIRKAKQLPSKGSITLPSQQAKEAVSRKIEALVKQFDSANTLTIELTEEELTTLLSEALAKRPIGQRFKQPQVELDPPLIVIRALLIDPLRSQTVWYIEPKVEKDELVARIVKVEAGKLSIPEAITGPLSTEVSELIASFVPLPGRFEPTTVEVRRDLLVISGRIK